MKAIVQLSRKKPLMIVIVVILGIIIFSSSFLIRKNQIAANDKFQEQSLGASTQASPKDVLMIDLLVEGNSISAVIGSDKPGECTLKSSKQTLSEVAKQQSCAFNGIDQNVEMIEVEFRSFDQSEYGVGKIRF